MPRHILPLGFAIACTLAIACLGPTQIEVRITTDVACATVGAKGVALFSGDASKEPPFATTRACEPAAATTTWARSSSRRAVIAKAPSTSRSSLA